MISTTTAIEAFYVVDILAKKRVLALENQILESGNEELIKAYTAKYINKELISDDYKKTIFNTIGDNGPFTPKPEPVYNYGSGSGSGYGYGYSSNYSTSRYSGYGIGSGSYNNYSGIGGSSYNNYYSGYPYGGSSRYSYTDNYYNTGIDDYFGDSHSNDSHSNDIRFNEDKSRAKVVSLDNDPIKSNDDYDYYNQCDDDFEEPAKKSGLYVKYLNEHFQKKENKIFNQPLYNVVKKDAVSLAYYCKQVFTPETLPEEAKRIILLDDKATYWYSVSVFPNTHEPWKCAVKVFSGKYTKIARKFKKYYYEYYGG